MSEEKGFKMNKEQIEILKHTRDRAAGRMFCGGSEDMRALCKEGLMACVGRKSFIPDPYFTITKKGLGELEKLEDLK